jgi:class 3 adenylate cyclase
MIEDMAARKLNPNTQRGHILSCKRFAAWLKRSPDTATPDRRELARYRGSEIKSLGDGFLATFDGPARAVRCACAIAEAVRPLGIEVRCGLHTGEIEVGDRDVQGIAVHVAARISAAAAAGEILVSRTVKDLVAGSGLRFKEHGAHSLKGLQDAMELYAASS